MYTGLDARGVYHAFESAKDSYAYNVASFTPASSTTSLADVKVELDSSGPVASLEVDSSVPLRSTTGRVRTQSQSTVDFFGNQTSGIALGCTEGCPSTDETITTTTEPALPDNDPTGWLWRTERSYVTGSVYFLGNQKDTAFDYDEHGALETTTYTLTDTVALDRFHATGGNVAATPSDASENGTISYSNTYSDFGNLTRETGPDSRCRDVSYDEDYEQLADAETIYTGGCDQGQELATGADYDRGLGLVTLVTNIQSQPTQVAYDGFGRMVSLTKPDPDSAMASSPHPSVKIEYFLPPDLTTSPSAPARYSIIHTMTQDAADLEDEDYLESYSYVDGMGRTLATLAEAETSGDWIVSGQLAYDTKGAVQRKFLESYYTGSPMSFPFGATPNTPYGSKGYDTFGRVVFITDLDGTVTLFSNFHALSTDIWDAADLGPGPHQDTYATERKDGHGRTVQTTERFGASERDTFTTYLPTGEPQVISRELAGTSEKVTRWMRYDSLGRMVLNVEPNTSNNFTDDYEDLPEDLHAWRYAYNDAGDLVGTSDARGCGENFKYDGAGRLYWEDYSPCESHHLAYGAPNQAQWNNIEVYYHYDTDPSIITNDTPTNYFSSTPSAFLKGKLVAVFDKAAINVSKYDGRGRVIGTARRIAKPGIFQASLSGRYTEHWFEKDTTYDSADREISTTTGATTSELLGSGSASEITTTYSNRGTVASAGGSYGTLVASTTRAADGLIEQVVYGDAADTTTDYAYDDRRRLSIVQTYREPTDDWQSPPGNYLPAPSYDSTHQPTYQSILQDDELTYDVVGNPTEIHDWRTADEWPDDAKPVHRSFEYDDLYRVTRADYDYVDANTWKSPFDAENTGATDPRLQKPLPHVTFSNRVAWQTYDYDWLGNTSSTDDDDHGFFDRSIGSVTNSSTKPYQLDTASNETTPGSPINKEGNVATAYDAAGNLTRLYVLRNGTCIPSGSQPATTSSNTAGMRSAA